MKRIILTILLFYTFLDASVLVIKASKNIKYKEKITSKDVYLKYVDNVKRFCIPISKDDIISAEYKAKINIKKGRTLCKKDLYISKENRLLFNFGSIEIEKDGKIIKETKEYIRIRNENGKIEKIYKNGLMK